MTLEYFCPRCFKSHLYFLDFGDVSIFGETVHVKAHARHCDQNHYVYRVFSKHDYEMACYELGIVPNYEVF